MPYSEKSQIYTSTMDRPSKSHKWNECPLLSMLWLLLLSKRQFSEKLFAIVELDYGHKENVILMVQCFEVEMAFQGTKETKLFNK